MINNKELNSQALMQITQDKNKHNIFFLQFV